MNNIIANLSALLACACLAAARPGAAADAPQVGIVASWQFKQNARSVPYQQTVWQRLLGRYRMFATVVVDDDVLNDPAALGKYRCLVLPSTRHALTRAQMDRLADYVRAGGKLIRDQHAVTVVGALGKNGWEVDAGPAARQAAADFWRTVGGVEDAGGLLAAVVRFPPGQGVLSELLPAEFKPVEALCDPAFDPLRQASGYALAGAAALAEAQADAAGGAAGKTCVLASIHRAGAGACVCLGINVRGLAGLGSPMAMYRDFFANLAFWIAEK